MCFKFVQKAFLDSETPILNFGCLLEDLDMPLMNFRFPLGNFECPLGDFETALLNQESSFFNFKSALGCKE